MYDKCILLKGFTPATRKWQNLADHEKSHIRHHPPNADGGVKLSIYKDLANIRHFRVEIEGSVFLCG